MAEIPRFPPSFRIEEIKTDGAAIHVRIGGKGPAVVMLHGFGDTGDMRAPLAATLVHDYTVVAPDLRGMGLSSHPEDGYDKKTQGDDIARVLDKLKIEKADFVTHDIGNMVGYAFAAQYPDRITRWVVMDAPLPGIGPWDEIIRSPAFGISISAVRKLSVWSKAASAFTSTASGTNYLLTRDRSTRRRGSTMPSFMRGPAPCIPRSISSRHLRKMRSTTRPSRPRAN